MTTHRREGRARIRRPRLGLARTLELVFMLSLMLAFIASAAGWLPPWVSFVALIAAITRNGIARIPVILQGFRELRAGIPRLDPDYRRRR